MPAFDELIPTILISCETAGTVVFLNQTLVLVQELPNTPQVEKVIHETPAKSLHNVLAYGHPITGYEKLL